MESNDGKYTLSNGDIIIIKTNIVDSDIDDQFRNPLLINVYPDATSTGKNPPHGADNRASAYLTK